MDLLRERYQGKLKGKETLEAVIHRPGININAADPVTGFTALHYACLLKDVDSIELLLKIPNIETGIQDSTDKLTPLLILLNALGQDSVWQEPGEFGRLVAASHGLAIHPSGAVAHVSPNGCSSLALVLELGHKLGELYRERRLFEELARSTSREIPVSMESNRTAMMVCVQLGWTKELDRILECQRPIPNLHAVDKNGMTALHIAGKLGRLQCVEVIIKKDSSLCNIKDENGNTALFYLIVKLLPRECLNFFSRYPTCWDYKAINSLGENILDYYDRYVDRFNRSVEVKNALWTISGLDNNSKETTRKNDLKKVSVMRDPVKEIDVREKGQAGAGHNCEKSLTSHLINMKSVERLFKVIAEKSGATIDSFNSRGYTALMSSAMYGMEEETEVLLHGRADVNKTNLQGETALHLAAKHGLVGVFQILCKQPNVHVNVQDKFGNTPLFYILEKFSRKDALTFIGDGCRLRWNFRVLNNSMLMPSDYYKQCLQRQPYNVVGLVHKQEDDKLINLLIQLQKRHENDDGNVHIRPTREPVENTEDSTMVQPEGNDDSGLSDNSARLSSSSQDSSDSGTEVKLLRVPPSSPIQETNGLSSIPCRLAQTLKHRRPDEHTNPRSFSQTKENLNRKDKRKGMSYDPGNSESKA